MQANIIQEYTDKIRKFFSFCEYGAGRDISTISNTITLDMIINGHNEKGYTSLMLCVIQHNVQMFNLILQIIKSGSKTTLESVRISEFLNGRNKHGHTVLHICLMLRNTKMLKSLIEAGCDPLTTDWELKNVYHYIAELKLFGFTECVHQALTVHQKGGENTRIVNEIEWELLSAKDHEGMTAIHTVIERHHDINLLIELLDPVYQDREKDDCLMIEMSKSHSTILHLAMEIGNAMLLEYILLRIPYYRKMEFIDQQNGYGNTALHLGVACNSIECVELLIHHGANMEKRNVVDELPIDYCESGKMRRLFRIPYKE